MTLKLSQKEKMLLEDQKSHEELCIKKYKDYSAKAESLQLKQLFNNYATKEQDHLDSINQMLDGQIPEMNQQQGQQSQQSQQGSQGQQSSQNSQQGMNQQTYQNAGFMSQNDTDLCHDMLMAEKYVSGAYDTAIFEMRDKDVRNVLNHIQKEEQQHGEGLYNYMSSHGMYSVK